MKKHHLFLLIVCLLLVASLAFPAATKTATATLHSVTYHAGDINSLPGKIVEGDTVHIKKYMDQLSITEGKEAHLQILKETPGQAPMPIAFNATTKWIQSENDEVPEEYYSVTLPVGKYIIRLTTTRTYSPTVQEKPSIINHEIEVFPQTNAVEAKKIRDEGDNNA